MERRGHQHGRDGMRIFPVEDNNGLGYNELYV